MMAQLGKLIEVLFLPIPPTNFKIGHELNRGAWVTVHEGQLDSKSDTMKNIHDVLKDAEGRDNALHSFFFSKMRYTQGLGSPQSDQ